MGKIETVKPEEIEKRSFAIIHEELLADGIVSDPRLDPVICRVIHATADFSFAENLVFSEGVTDILSGAFKNGAHIVTDTQMARAGINKRSLSSFGGEVFCFMSDPDVAEEARERGITRAAVSMERAAALSRASVLEGRPPAVLAVGNAPTALIRTHELLSEGLFPLSGIIAAPVGFVNVVEAKELIIGGSVPFIAARGRKGGSPVAAAVCNAILYGLSRPKAV